MILKNSNQIRYLKIDSVVGINKLRNSGALPESQEIILMRKDLFTNLMRVSNLEYQNINISNVFLK